MKKKAILAALTLFCSGLIFAETERKAVGFQFAIGSGVPIYGDADLQDNITKMGENKYNRFLMTSDVALSVKLAPPLFLLVGADSIADFNWNTNYYCNCLDIAFFTGLQFYPGWGNLSFTIAYELGRRNDFIKVYESYKSTSASDWGNGFKLAAEYDFVKGGGAVPGIGISWRLMPRGELNYDNILSVYFRLGIR